MNQVEEVSESALASKSLRRVWVFVAGQGISLLGTDIGTIALPLVVVLVYGYGPAELSILTAAGFIPALFSPVFAGPIADRFDRRLTLLWCDVGRTLVVVATVVALSSGIRSFYLLVGLMLVRAVLANIFDAAYFAFLPDLLDKRRLVMVNGRLSVVQNIAAVMGPAVGGALAPLLGIYTLLLDAISYAASVVTIGLVRTEGKCDDESRQRGRFLESIAEGFAILVALRPVAFLAFSSAAMNIFLGAQEALLVLFAVRAIGMSAHAVGICLAIGALGGIVMGLIVERLVDHHSLRMLLGGSIIAVTVSVLAISAVPSGSGPFLMGGLLFVQTAGLVPYSIVNGTLRQLLVPKAARGRVFATMRLLSRGVIPLGAIVGGLIAEYTSLRMGVLFAGLGLMLVSIWIIVGSSVMPKRLDDVEPN